MSSLEEYRRVNCRKASAITIGGFRPTRNPLASHFGLRPLALPSESWPEQNNEPLFFICQLNLTEISNIPEALTGVALLTVFIDRNAYFGKQNGDGWLVREYKSLDGLLPMTIPDGATVDRGFEVRYDQVDDYPVYDDPEIKQVDGFDSSNVHLDNVYRSKIGGYASNIQSEQWWGYAVNHDDKGLVDRYCPSYCFQIASEEKVQLYWGDNGIIYFARSTAADEGIHWFLDTQCY